MTSPVPHSRGARDGTPGAPPDITSLANPRVKEVVRLRQRSHRDEAGLMLIEGYRELKRALDNGYRPTTVFTCRELFMGIHEDTLLDRAREAGATVLECSRNVFGKMSARDRPDGLLATGPQLRMSLSDLSLPDDALVVVAEGIEKPGNLGTILRSADAAGASAVIVCDRRTDVNNPNVVRASIGTLFALPVVEASTAETLDWLAARRFTIVATTPHARELHTGPDMTGPTAIVVGAEQYGLTDVWLSSPSCRPVRIPMLGQADSLNVSAAATILLFEATRQRVARDPSIVPPPKPDEPTGRDLPLHTPPFPEDEA
jgi:TrmH family RNA methyltransferase